MPTRPERDRDLDALKSSVRAFAEKHHARRAFEPGVSPAPVTRKELHPQKLEMLLHAFLRRAVHRLLAAVLEGWWPGGRFGRQLAAALAGFLATRAVLLCPSGSSAN